MKARLTIGCVLLLASCSTAQRGGPAAQPELGSRSKPVLSVQGRQFRDLNGNGKLDAYEDWRLSVRQRAADLVAQMTLEEKAGALMHGSAPAAVTAGVTGAGTAYDVNRARTLIANGQVNSVITRLSAPPERLAEQNNALQAIAESTRLGIPMTISTDPRNHFQFTAGAAVASAGFSQWPEMLGMAAIGDAALVRRFGDVARQEYRAVGIHMGLSPQADLATEPRWARVTATFGENTELVGRLARAYVEGFQGGTNGVRRDGVAMVIKHFAGYGAAKDGWDSHNYYGRYATFPGGKFDEHVRAFRPAFDAKVAGVMPTYSVLSDLRVDGQLVEQVGSGYNRWLLTDVLRKREGFPGLVLSDWGITNDCGPVCRDGAPAGQIPGFGSVSTAWGVTELTKPQRFAKGLNAGLDQFGGAEEGAQLVLAVKQGLVTEARIDESVQRVLLLKFELGLFENPYVDPAAAAKLVGNAAFDEEGSVAQRRALVLLENRDALLPLKAGIRKVFLHGVDPAAAQRAGLEVVTRVEDAQVAIIRTATPFQVLHPGYVFGAMQHEGDLDFKPGDPMLALLESTARKIPTIVTVMLDRPAILTNVKPLASALLGNFGVSDAALLDVITGRAKAAGRLPFELPASMDAVRAQHSDVASDSRNPLYPFGYGLAAQ